MMPLVSEPTNPPRRGAFALAVVALLGVHLFFFNYFMPLGVWWTDQPIVGIDYETHVAQTWRAIEGLDGWGHSWVYDTHLLAGTPAGVIFDADNKGWEVWTWLLHRLGLSKGFAFNLFAVAAHWLLLPVVFLSARLFGLARGGALADSARRAFPTAQHIRDRGGGVSFADAPKHQLPVEILSAVTQLSVLEFGQKVGGPLPLHSPQALAVGEGTAQHDAVPARPPAPCAWRLPRRLHRRTAADTAGPPALAGPRFVTPPAPIHTEAELSQP